MQRGTSKVYATARHPERVDLDGVEVLRLDLTDPALVTAATEAAGDVTLLVNNAGISTGTDLLGDLDEVRLESRRAMNLLPVPWAEAIDISHAVVCLAFDDSRYVTGATTSCGRTG